MSIALFLFFSPEPSSPPLLPTPQTAWHLISRQLVPRHLISQTNISTACYHRVFRCNNRVLSVEHIWLRIHDFLFLAGVFNQNEWIGQTGNVHLMSYLYRRHNIWNFAIDQHGSLRTKHLSHRNFCDLSIFFSIYGSAKLFVISPSLLTDFQQLFECCEAQNLMCKFLCMLWRRG